ncbi:RluA family pseudouridine synthase [Paenibacillus sp. NEAU-GSW1]|uniref:RluA family pseudouridine synthase n=1 Tax=Paenibacillus sp. NEAU-GSW1 TaxID=2682486 RepID=UPI0012E2360B|nr:RluA family pseudouridine synthase [Paenibacillus sp. NEAU-GSW1]MUT64515.1 RluA family pseudouridine synthase [Paenibacillus sp. NEAU-GSW1]
MLEFPRYAREGQWLTMERKALERFGDAPESGTHPHAVRQWLIVHAPFPAKWVNRLFSVGGIRWREHSLQLLAFPQADGAKEHLRAGLAACDIIPPVLYEDDFCAVFHKPAGMAVHESRPGEGGTLDDAAARYMQMKDDPLPMRHIHRLDDDTSGPVLYSKNDLAQLLLDDAMREKRIDRRYIAVVHGRLAKQSGTVNAPIGKDRHHPSRRRVAPGGDTAVTHYERVEIIGNASIVRLRLETGRTHQIRVHMSHLGYPLIGDALYGGDPRLLGHQALHGEKLVFTHPWTSQLIEANAPEPDWLRQLRDKLASRKK